MQFAKWSACVLPQTPTGELAIATAQEKVLPLLAPFWRALLVLLLQES